jgi:pyridoxine kinase
LLPGKGKGAVLDAGIATGPASADLARIMAILSIQSQVVSGYVGNSAAVFALQRVGREVWPVPTTLLSHHPGHGGADGGRISPELLNRLLDGLVNRGCFSHCQAVLSGYLGHEDAAACVARAVKLAKAGTPGAVYLCDPVLGDDGRLYVRGEIVTAMHELILQADILTPNDFELALLTGHACANRQTALQAMRLLQSKGPRLVVLSSFAGDDTPAGTLDLLALDGADAWALNVRRFEQKFHGAGDLFAALFLEEWLTSGRDTGRALGGACAAVQAILGETAGLLADALQLIGAQHLLDAPPRLFVPQRIG